MLTSNGLLSGSSGSALATKRMLPRPSVPAGGRSPLSIGTLVTPVSTSHQEVLSRPQHPQATSLEVVQ